MVDRGSPDSFYALAAATFATTASSTTATPSSSFAEPVPTARLRQAPQLRGRIAHDTPCPAQSSISTSSSCRQWPGSLASRPTVPPVSAAPSPSNPRRQQIQNRQIPRRIFRPNALATAAPLVAFSACSAFSSCPGSRSHALNRIVAVAERCSSGFTTQWRCGCLNPRRCALRLVQLLENHSPRPNLSNVKSALQTAVAPRKSRAHRASICARSMRSRPGFESLHHWTLKERIRSQAQPSSSGAV